MRAWAVAFLGVLLGCSSPDTLDGDDGAPTTGGTSSSGTGGQPPSSGGTGASAGDTDAGEPGLGGTSGSSGGATPHAGTGGRAGAPAGGTGSTGGMGGAPAAGAGMGGMAGSSSAGMAGMGGTEPTTRSLLGCGDGSSRVCAPDSYIWLCPDELEPVGTYTVPGPSTKKLTCEPATGSNGREWCCNLGAIQDTRLDPATACPPQELPFQHNDDADGDYECVGVL